MGKKHAAQKKSTGRRKPMAWLRIILRTCFIAACLYGVFVYALYVTQDHLIFFPTKMTEDRWTEVAKDLHGDYVTIKVSDRMYRSGISGKWKREAIHLQGWFFADGSGKPRPTIIVFPGNAEKLDLLSSVLSPLREEGMNLLLVDYRGYGLSEGKPSTDTMRADAGIVFDAAARHPLVDSGSIIALGESLGTGIAAHLASIRPVARVILLSPFTSTLELARTAYWFVPVDLLLKHRLDTLALAPTLSQPALIIHGTLDDQIPLAQGKAVADSWKGPKIFLTPPLGHNIIADPDVLQAIAAFVKGAQTETNDI